MRLSPQQEHVIIERITAGPEGKVALEFSAADRIRVRDFAHTLGALGSAGLEVSGYIPAFQEAAGPPIVGLRIGVKPGVAESVGFSLRDALAAVRLIAAIFDAFRPIFLRSRFVRFSFLAFASRRPNSRISWRRVFRSWSAAANLTFSACDSAVSATPAFAVRTRSNPRETTRI